MFEDVGAAVAAHRDAARSHERARAVGDWPSRFAALHCIRDIAGYLRAESHPELIFPLVMEWITEGHSPAEYACHRALVDHLLAVAVETHLAAEGRCTHEQHDEATARSRPQG